MFSTDLLSICLQNWFQRPDLEPNPPIQIPSSTTSQVPTRLDTSASQREWEDAPSTGISRPSATSRPTISLKSRLFRRVRSGLSKRTWRRCRLAFRCTTRTCLQDRRRRCSPRLPISTHTRRSTTSEVALVCHSVFSYQKCPKST